MIRSDSLTYLFLTFLKKYLHSQPFSQKVKLSQMIASFLYYHYPIRKKLARDNIKQAFPKKSNYWIDSVLSRSFQFFVHNFISFISFPKSWENTEFHIIGKNVLDNALRKNKGVIFLSAHFGPWEMMGVWLAKNNYPITGIAQRQKNRGANDFFQQQRELSGAKHIFKKESFDKMYNILNKKEILVLISDQDARSRGVFVDFLGQQASTPRGAAIFYKRTGAPLIVGTCIQTDLNKYQIEFVSVKPNKIDEREITQTYTNIFSAYIRKHPEQYFWFHRRWKTKLKNDKKN